MRVLTDSSTKNYTEERTFPSKEATLGPVFSLWGTARTERRRSHGRVNGVRCLLKVSLTKHWMYSKAYKVFSEIFELKRSLRDLTMWIWTVCVWHEPSAVFRNYFEWARYTYKTGPSVHNYSQGICSERPIKNCTPFIKTPSPTAALVRRTTALLPPFGQILSSSRMRVPNFRFMLNCLQQIQSWRLESLLVLQRWWMTGPQTGASQGRSPPG